MHINPTLTSAQINTERFLYTESSNSHDSNMTWNENRCLLSKDTSQNIWLSDFCLRVKCSTQDLIWSRVNKQLLLKRQSGRGENFKVACFKQPRLIWHVTLHKIFMHSLFSRPFDVKALPAGPCSWMRINVAGMGEVEIEGSVSSTYTAVARSHQRTNRIYCF